MLKIRATRQLLSMLNSFIRTSIDSTYEQEQASEMRRQPLSPKLERAMSYIRRRVIGERMPPTISEMCHDLRMGRGTTQWYVDELIRRGHLVRGRGGRIALPQGEPVPIFEIPVEVRSETPLDAENHIVEYMPEMLAQEWASESHLLLRIGAPGEKSPGFREGEVVAIRREKEPGRGRMTAVRIGTGIVFRVFVEQDAKRVVLVELDAKGNPGEEEEFTRAEHDIRIEGVVVHMLAKVDIAELDYLDRNGEN